MNNKFFNNNEVEIIDFPLDEITINSPTNSIDDSNDLLKKDFIIFENVCKEYTNDETYVKALNDVSFTIKEGDLVVFLGNSGAGKSTALNALGGTDTITSGKVIVNGKEISKYTLEELTDYRKNEIGFVFQFYNLIQNLTIKENVELVTEISANPLDVVDILNKVGLGEKLNNFPSQLSGGEQQRAAIARAIAKNPRILLCDEPTGALDYITGKQILKLIQDTCRERKMTVIIITHNSAIAPMADQIIRFKSGCVISNEFNEKTTDIGEIEW